MPKVKGFLVTFPVWSEWAGWRDQSFSGLPPLDISSGWGTCWAWGWNHSLHCLLVYRKDLTVSKHSEAAGLLQVRECRYLGAPKQLLEGIAASFSSVHCFRLWRHKAVLLVASARIIVTLIRHSAELTTEALWSLTDLSRSPWTWGNWSTYKL